MSTASSLESVYIDTKTLYMSSKLFRFKGNQQIVNQHGNSLLIPPHFIASLFVCNWRDGGSSLLDKVARRFVTGVVLAALSVIAVVDSLARLIIGLVSIPFNKKIATFLCLDAVNGFSLSVDYITFQQKANVLKDKITLKHLEDTNLTRWIVSSLVKA